MSLRRTEQFRRRESGPNGSLCGPLDLVDRALLNLQSSWTRYEVRHSESLTWREPYAPRCCLTRVILPNANWQTLQILQNKPTANFLRSCANPLGFARVKPSILETVVRCSLAHCAK